MEIPGRIRAADTVADPDYTWACELTAADGDDRTAVQWARAVFEGAPRPLRWFMLAGWLGVLRLRPGPRSDPDLVFGWEILSASPGRATLGIDGTAFTTHLVVDVQGPRVVHATFVRFERRRAKILWTVCDPVHRLTITYLMNRAARAAATADSDEPRRRAGDETSTPE
ncbi:hypothetical protein BAY61_13460 [Prauserella marina]|nr:hypothetical protein BAY61_13460 [Prauserella marina]